MKDLLELCVMITLATTFAVLFGWENRQEVFAWFILWAIYLNTIIIKNK